MQPMIKFSETAHVYTCIEFGLVRFEGVKILSKIDQSPYYSLGVFVNFGSIFGLPFFHIISIVTTQ